MLRLQATLTVYPIYRRLSSTFSKLAQRNIHILLSRKPDHQPVGQTHDLRAAAAISAIHAVVVGAGGLCHSDFSVPDRNRIAAAVGGGDGEGLIDSQIYGFDYTAAAENLGKPRAFSGAKEENAE